MGGEDGQKRLEGIVEDDLVVLPGMNWSQLHSQLERGRNGTLALQPRVEFEMVVKGHLFLSRFWDEMYLYVNLELSPPGFRNLERWFIDVWIATGGYLHFVLGEKWKASDSCCDLLRTAFGYVSCNLNVTRLTK